MTGTALCSCTGSEAGGGGHTSSCSVTTEFFHSLLPSAQPKTSHVGWAEPRPAGEQQGRAARGSTAQHGLAASARAGNKPPARASPLDPLLAPAARLSCGPRGAPSHQHHPRQDGRPWDMRLAGISQYMPEGLECSRSALPRQGTAAPGMAEPAFLARLSLALPCLASPAGCQALPGPC